MISPSCCLFPVSQLSKSVATSDTDLCVSNPPVEHLVQDDEPIGGPGCVPFDQHIGRLGCHYLMGDGPRDVVCLLCGYQTQKNI